MRTSRHNSRSGFTLIEIAITAGLLGLIAGIMAMVSLRSQSAVTGATLANSVDNDCRRALDRAAAELTTAGSGQLNPVPSAPFGTQSLIYRQGTGVAGGVITWGPQVRIAFEYSADEPNDGADNNGNGLIDEGVLVLTRNPGQVTQQRIVISHDLREYAVGETLNGLDDNGNGVRDEQGFNALLTGTVLTLRLTIERVLPGQAAYVRTLQTSVKLWN